MQLEKGPLEGLVIVTPKAFEDDRGFFMETYRKSAFEEMGVKIDFVQENHSRSEGIVLRGLHFQKPPKAQDKLVRCIVGSVFDVAVDIRKDSPTFGQWFGIELSAQNKKQLLVPIGFAHGFCTLSDVAEIEYKVSDYYSKEDEGAVNYADTEIGIEWPVENPTLSDKDKIAPNLSESEFYF